MGFGAAFMLHATPMTARWLHGIDGVCYVALTFVAVSSFVAVSGAGASTSRRPPGFGSARSETWDIPHPMLPLRPEVRALTEAIAGVGVLAVFQTLLVAIAPLVRYLVPFNLGDSVFGSLSGTIATWCVLVPGTMAWLLPAQSQVINLLRGLAVTVLAAVIFVISLTSMPLAIDLAVGLIAVALTTARVAMIAGPFMRKGALSVGQGFLVRRSDARTTTSSPERRAGGSRANERSVMFRASRSPLAQLWRDACLGPLRSAKLPVMISAAGLVMAGAIARTHAGPEMLAAFVASMVPLLAAFWLAWHVLGTPTTTAGRGVAPGWFSGDIGLAWTRLPLRREWVMRAFYFHGVMTGLTFLALSLLGLAITGFPPLFVGGIPGEPFSWIPLLCAVPPLAGLMTCAAAGDRVRGSISLTSFAFIVIALPYNSTPIAAACGLAGGLPPLVHLFNARR
jgi:hypothetical protein